jgi:hypothetical protein
MHQLKNRFNRTTLKHQSIEQLEAEYHRNQQRIQQINHRNQKLAEQILGLQQTQPMQAVPSITSARQPRSLLRRVKDLRHGFRSMQWGKQSPKFWMQTTILGLGIALVCGFLSFMVTRLIASLLGG